MESGLIVEGAVSENRRPPTSVVESINFDFDVIGAARLRRGLTRVGQALSGSMLGLHYFVDSVSSSNPKSQLITVNGTVAYYLNSTTWTSIRAGLTDGSKARFSTFLNFVFMVNGVDATAIWNGDTAGSFVTTGNASGAPIGKFIENYRTRMWIAGNPTYPDRLFYSSVPSAVTTPVISWDTNVATGQWIDVSPSDGESITALWRTKRALLVFKKNHFYRIYSINQTDPDPFFDVGTSSQESVVETKTGVYFHHSTGFYQYEPNGGTVQEISRPIIDIIRAISTANYSKVTGSVEPDGDHINWSIGDVTYNGVAYSKMVVRYTVSTQTWSHRLYPTQFLCGVSRQPIYTDGSTQFALVGDTNGGVFEMNTGKTDDGTEISYSLTHNWDLLDSLLSTRKTLQQGMFSHYGGTGTNVAYQIDGTPENDWSKAIGQFKEINTGFNTMNIKARKVRFRIFGSSKGEPFLYEGYELVGVTNELLQFPN